MRKIKKIIILTVASLLLQTGICSPEAAHAQEAAQSAWSITQNLDMETCSYDDVVTLSVYGTAAGSDAVTISEISAELEYDTSLFTVTADDIAPAGSGSSVEFNNGSVRISYSSGKTFTSGALLFTADFLATDKSSSGKTTICVTDMTIVFSDGQKAEIENYNPSSILYEETPEEIETETEEEESEETSAVTTEKKTQKTVTKKASGKTAASTEKTETSTPVFKTGAGGEERIFMIAGGVLLLVGAGLFAVKKKCR